MKDNTLKIFRVPKDADWCLLGFHLSMKDLYTSRNHCSKSKEIKHLFRNPPKKGCYLCAQKPQKESNTMQNNPFYCHSPSYVAFLLCQALGTQQALPKYDFSARMDHISKLRKRKVQHNLSRLAVRLWASTIPRAHQGIGGQASTVKADPRILMEVVYRASESCPT